MNNKIIINYFITSSVQSMYTLRPHQQDAIFRIKETLKNHDKCLVKMFCGTGKTLIAFDMMTKNNYDCSVIIFPSISLITQFNTDYINRYPSSTKDFKFMSICSKDEIENNVSIKYTTDPDINLNLEIETIKIYERFKISRY